MGELERLRFWIGADLGQSHDYSAAVVTERVGEEIHVGGISRAPLRTAYTAIAKGLVDKCCELEAPGPFHRPQIGLVTDAGGVGRAVADLIRAEIHGRPRPSTPKIRYWPVSATGGAVTAVSIGSGAISVPKRELISSAVVAFQQGRLKIGAIPNAELLLEELKEYRQKLTGRGNLTFEGGGRNDDLVYALALATWAWSHTRPERSEAGRSKRRGPVRGAVDQRRFSDA